MKFTKEQKENWIGQLNELRSLIPIEAHDFADLVALQEKYQIAMKLLKSESAEDILGGIVVYAEICGKAEEIELVLEGANKIWVDFKKQLSAKDTKIQKIEKQLDVKDTTINGIKEQLSARNTKIQKIEGQLDAKDKTITGMKNQLDAKDDIITGMKKQLDAKDTTINVIKEQLISKIQEIEEQLDAKDDIITGMKNQLDAKNTRIGELEKQLTQKNTGITTHQKSTGITTPQKPLTVNKVQEAQLRPAEAPNKKITATKPGSIIEFGHYPQKASGTDKTPIRWIVLKNEGNRMLVLSQMGLDCMEYHNTKTDVTWSKSNIRKWLNNEFREYAFGTSEADKISFVLNENQNNPSYKTEGGKATKDQLFLLSLEETKQYMNNADVRRCKATEYAVKHRAFVNHNKGSKAEGFSWWWLRSPGSGSHNAAYVDTDGSLGINGFDVSYPLVTIRPAMWLKI